MCREHAPFVAVLHPPPVGDESTIVLARHHQVVHADHQAASATDDVNNEATLYSVGLCSQVELRDGLGVTGQHERSSSAFTVGVPRCVERVEEMVATAFYNSVAGVVGVERSGIAASDLQAFAPLPCGLEPSNVPQRRCVVAPVAYQCTKHSAGVNAGELRPVTGEHHFCPCVAGSGHEFVEGEGRGETGFVHDHQLSRTERPTLKDRFTLSGRRA